MLFNHNKHVKKILDRVKLLIQGLELSLQERESKLYDDSFVLHAVCSVINDMHMIGMIMKPFQVNTKFVNHLPPEWSKFVTNELSNHSRWTSHRADGSAETDARYANNRVRNTATRVLTRKGMQFKKGWLSVVTIKRKTVDLDAFDSDYVDVPLAKAILMVNLSLYDSDVLSEVPFHDTNIETDTSYQNLTPKEKERYKAHIRATHIILQGLPKEIYILINHYTDAEDIFDNVKILLEGYKLTKDERESQLYDDFEHFCQNKEETIQEYYVRFVTAVKLNRGLKTSKYDELYAYLKQHEAHANENKMILERYNQHAIDPLAFVSNISPQQYPTQSLAIPQSVLSEEARIQEEEDAEELYRDVNINQGRGLQVTQNVEDTHVILTPVIPDNPQESSSMSSFVSSMLNPLSDVGVESIFTTPSSQIVSLEPPTPIITPSTIATITTSGEAPIPPPTIPSIILENLPTFNSAFRFEERLRSLETSFSEHRQTNQFVDAVSAIPDIVHHDVGVESIFTTASSSIVSLQTPTPIMTPSTIATITTSSEAPIPPPTIPSIILDNLPTFNLAFCFEERLRSLETSFSEYRQTNPFVNAVSMIHADLSKMELKKILIEKMEGNKSIQRSDEQRNLYKVLVEAYDADKAILDTYGDSTILKRRRKDDDQEGPFAGSNRRSTTRSQSRQLSASESAFAKEPVQTTCQMEEPPHPVFETGADDQPIIQTSQYPKWFSQPRRPPLPDYAWNKTLPAAQGDAQSWISDLARQTDARSSFNELLDTPIDFSNFIMNWLNVDTLTLDLLAGPTYE
nr:hypothetical protein [Tanacetum cinerariifolium]